MTTRLWYLLSQQGKRQVGELSIVGETKHRWNTKTAGGASLIFSKDTGKRIGHDGGWGVRIHLITEKEYIDYSIEFCKNRLKHNREKLSQLESDVKTYEGLVDHDELRLQKHLKRKGELDNA